MKFLIAVGKVITLGVWAIMAYNLVIPFEGSIAVILNLFFAMTIFMHCFQVVIFHNLFKSLLTLKKSDYFNVFVFGACSLFTYRKQVMDNPVKNQS